MSVGLQMCPKTCKLCSELAQLKNVDRGCIEDQAHGSNPCKAKGGLYDSPDENARGGTDMSQVTDTPCVDDPVYRASWRRSRCPGCAPSATSPEPDRTALARRTA